MSSSPDCDLCGGSGVLQIVSSATQDEVEAPWDTRWDLRSYASACHGCAAGQAWSEAGL